MTNSKPIILLMLTVSILIPFGNDVFLASMPQIQHVFSVTNVGTLFSAYLLGLAFGQLAYGPLFDYFGRKPVLLVGLCIYLLGNIIIVTSVNFNIMLLGRFIIAIGACSAAVACMAIVRDSFTGHDIAKYIAVVMGIIAVCPTISPIVGSFIQIHYGWKGAFCLLIIFAIFCLCITFFLFKESMLEKNKQALHINKMLHTYVSFLKHQRYMAFTIISCCSYAVMFAYISVASFILLIMNFITPKISKVTFLEFTTTCGVLFIALGVVLLALLTAIFGFNVVVLIIGVSIMLGGGGMIRPSAAAGAMRIFPANIAGSASALFLFFSFLGGVISTVVSSVLLAKSIYAFYAFYAVLGAFAVIALLMLLSLAKTSVNTNH